MATSVRPTKEPPPERPAPAPESVRAPAPHRAPEPRGGVHLWKRLALGPALPTAQLKHERLGKPTALAVFASDNLSSVAYATEEILKVAVPAVGALAFTLVMPVTFGILAVLAILLFSYRQTIKAYPSAGGAYIVTKDNFGLLAAQLAGVALLTDYVLTVSVSVAAGVAAITSAAPGLYSYRVWLSVAFIWFIAWGNLRGVRESGRMFAVPTYFFIVMMFLLLGVGIAKAFAGDLHPLPIPPDVAQTTGAIGVFLVLHAFASGGAAVTGVEAISNGVPAFKPPEWLHARTTLMWMGSLLGVMFLGLSFLAMKLQVAPTETKTVISEVGRAVFGSGAVGTALFLMLQIATTLILILAANTSFADFPRLANFHAQDHFMPRPLTLRGRRLVFSNGIIGLAIASTALVVLFRADVHKLIPLYAIGVFTSFTLSQAGMARRHLRLHEPGWRHGLLINGLGAVTTAVVTVVIAITKFAHGAWAVMVFVPVMVWLLVRMNHRYSREQAELDTGTGAFERGPAEHPIAVVLVDDLDRKTLHALQYAKTIRSSAIRALHVERDRATTDRLRARWAGRVVDVPLDVVERIGDPTKTITRYVDGLAGTADVSFIVPGSERLSRWERLRRGRTGARLARAFATNPRVRVTLVRDHTEPHAGGDGLRLLPRASHRAVVLVDKPDRAALQAVRYALSLGAEEVVGVHAAVDPDMQDELIARWMELRIPIALDLVECWDRDVARSVERYVVDLMGPRTEITVVLPRRDDPGLAQRFLHDRTSRSIARALGRYEHVDIAVVPFYLGATPAGRATIEEDREHGNPTADLPAGTHQAR
ncbi:MAG TPA: APC family permease [Actinomycetota bacterium]|nr:APC family permease [Actinomycetota bacterium]